MRFKKRYFFFVFFISILLLFLTQVPVIKILTFPNNILFFSNDIDYVNKNKVFGDYVTVSISQNALEENELKEPTLEFKLFNLIPINKKKIRVLDERKIYAGGMAVGLVLNSEGVLIVGSSPVESYDGEHNIEEETGLKIGDIIVEIQGEKITDTSSVSKVINMEENRNKELIVKILRNGNQIELKITPFYDVKGSNYKLGVWVRDDASGIGTLTFVDSKFHFGALGHPICDNDTKTVVNLKDGKLYNCTIMGVNKGVGGIPGEIRGLFLQGKNEQGYIEKNNEFGVFGKLNDDSNLIEMVEEFELGGRLTVKPGKAQIRCCIDGNIKLYDIEIIKTNYQNFSNDKSMVVRVIDEDLLAKTGGIVQGMSGSPIIQEGKLVGAITHVFVNDPTKGFGIYLDWMYDVK